MISNRCLKDFAALVVLFMYVIHVSGDPQCEDLPVINNGQVQLEDNQIPPFSVNDFLSYTCNADFRTDEINPKVICVLRDNNVANWTEGACKPIIKSCHDPGYIENAHRTGNVFLFPHSVTYECNEGFRMTGIGTKYCSKTGQWHPSGMPECEAIICPALSHPLNGKVLPSNRRLNSVADYKCDRYYKLVGDLNRKCQQDGTWSGSNPTCEKITCMAPGKFPNGHIIGKNATVYEASDILIFRCNDRVTHGTSKCLDNGEWSAQPPICPGSTVIELTTLAPTAGPETDKKEGKVDGTTLAPTTVPEIGEKGEIIEENTCEDPGKIKNGDRTFIRLQINSTVTYTCDEGYELRGKSTLLCLENGKWDLDKLPMCVKPLSIPTIFGIVFGVIIFVICIGIGGYFWYRYRMKSIRGYGEKSKALTADATDIEEIAGLERDKKQIPVTVL